MDPKMASYLASQAVKLLNSNPRVSPELKALLQDVMEADGATITYRRIESGSALDLLGTVAVDNCDYVTFRDAKGNTRHLIFI
jgi:hypothetical protein